MRLIPQNKLNILLLVIMQMIISNFIYLGPYIIISLMPFVMFLMPLSWSQGRMLLLTAAVSLPVDIFAEGVPGLNALALLPIAYARPLLLSITAASDSKGREGVISPEWMGTRGFTALAGISLLAFLTIYNIADCAGTRPASFVATRTLISTVINLALYIPLSRTILKLPKR